jgi:hypothetical protein
MSRALSVLVHGNAKSGKSTFAATAPAPRLYLDIEGGTRFLNITERRWNPNTEAPPENDGSWDTAVVHVPDWNTALKAYAWLQSGAHPFASVIVDSISELQQRLIEQISGRTQTAQQQWGDILRQFMGLMRDFRDLTNHPTKPVESIALVSMTRTGADGLYHPWLQGQAAVILPYLVDVCAATHVQPYIDPDSKEQLSVYRLLIGQNTIYEVGERTGGRLPAHIDNPNLVQMLDMVFGPAPVPATV